MSVVWKPIEPDHAPAWAELSNLLARVDDTDEFYEPEDLVEELGEPGVDPSLDTIAAWDGDTMVAYGQLRISEGLVDRMAKALLSGGVHPEWRGMGLGRAVMDWIEPRAAELATARYPSLPLVCSVWCGKPSSSAVRLAAARGYGPARYFQDMRAELAGWRAPASPFGAPAGARPGARSWTSDRTGDHAVVLPLAQDHAEGTRRAHNEAFSDHWGAVERDAARWSDQLAARSFRPALSRVALSADPSLDPDEAVDAYVLCNEFVPGELYVALVGTRRRARGRGLATRLLSEVLGAARESGYRLADLGVDSESPTGAVGLYERVGFRALRTTVVYERRP
ncbi:GNAT family N-acetyltransferase [Sinomonas mesophila]|uniref:GNAT family N-acetyltransferase n=1 Tax=Sinomonas mesophila TaxID=1531955 RepID=UPI000986540C|nr:GNAT family N-acetyltransferase [Sinomonas mesophila]